MRLCLKRSEIVRGKAFFRQIYDSGTEFRGKVIQCFAAPLITVPQSKNISCYFGVKVSHSVKRATDRNLIKRLIRETYRLNKKLLYNYNYEQKDPMGLLFIYRRKQTSSSLLPSFNDFDDDMKKILIEISQKQI